MPKSLDVKPNSGEMIKPRELIEIRKSGSLTLDDRRVFNLLIQNAWGENLGDANHAHVIKTADLQITYNNNSQIRSCLKRLRNTEVTIVKQNGDYIDIPLISTTKVNTTKNHGTVTYFIAPYMSEVINNSQVFAILETEVMFAFGSKYALSLYENLCRRVNLKHVHTEYLSIEDMRNILSVEDGKLIPMKNLNRIAIEPAMKEVNALAPFSVNIVPDYRGKKIVGFSMGWYQKSMTEKQQAFAEIKRPKVGRKARINGTAVYTVEEHPETVEDKR